MLILLVEDDAATAVGIKLMLKKVGFICDTTDLGDDGLEVGKLYAVARAKAVVNRYPPVSEYGAGPP
jgi:DNA-binding response OmpR family regulator